MYKLARKGNNTDTEKIGLKVRVGFWQQQHLDCKQPKIFTLVIQLIAIK